MAAAVVSAAAALMAAGVPLSLFAALDATVRTRATCRLLADAVSAPGVAVGVIPVARIAGAWRPLVASRRAAARRASALPTTLTLVVQQLRSGASLLQALDAAAAGAPPELAADLQRVVRRARHGTGLVDALGWWASERHDDEAVRMAAAALAAAAETGGPAAHAVEVVAGVVRERRALAGEVSALTAQARASAAVIGLAPLAMAVIAGLADPAAAAFLLTTAPGLAMLVAGVALDVIGAAWMAAMVRRCR